MNEALIKNWNAKVGAGDEVYVLGDFAFCKGREANNLLRRLNGQKFLVVGNHDKSFLKDPEFDRGEFVWIKDYAEIRDEAGERKLKLILFHYPIAVWNGKHHGSVHLYGHIHSNKPDNHPLTHFEPNSYNVGVDVRGYAPVTLREILASDGYVPPEGADKAR